MSAEARNKRKITIHHWVFFFFLNMTQKKYKQTNLSALLFESLRKIENFLNDKNVAKVKQAI